jgi:hypothetical protein
MGAHFWRGYRGTLDEVTSHSAVQPTLASGMIGDTEGTGALKETQRCECRTGTSNSEA